MTTPDLTQTYWHKRHSEARANPSRPEELAIVAFLRGITEYNLRYRREYGEGVETDGVLGHGIACIFRGVRVLLDGELGRLDGGLVWQELDHLAKDCGWKDLDAACTEGAE